MMNILRSLLRVVLILASGSSHAEDAAIVSKEAAVSAGPGAKVDTDKAIEIDFARAKAAKLVKQKKAAENEPAAAVTEAASPIDPNVVIDTAPLGEVEAVEGDKTPGVVKHAAPVNLANPVQPTSGTVGDGSRISLDDKGFSITPPEGWKIRRDLPRTSLYLQAANPIDNYVRNIGVVKFTGPKVINEITADEFSTYLVKNFPAASPEISDYQLRNHQPVQMADGREGILFYTDFKVHGRSMMQAHILLSSETNHYLATFTDLAEHFENPTSNTGYLAEAWESMISIELNSPNPKPLEEAQNTFLYIGIAAILGIGFVIWRNRVAGRMYSDYGSMEPGEALEVDPKTNALDDDLVSTHTNVDELHGADTKQAKVFSFRDKKIAQVKKKEFPDAAAAPETKQDIDFDDELPKDHWKVS